MPRVKQDRPLSAGNRFTSTVLAKKQDAGNTSAYSRKLRTLSSVKSLSFSTDNSATTATSPAVGQLEVVNGDANASVTNCGDCGNFDLTSGCNSSNLVKQANRDETMVVTDSKLENIKSEDSEQTTTASATLNNDFIASATDDNEQLQTDSNNQIKANIAACSTSPLSGSLSPIQVAAAGGMNSFGIGWVVIDELPVPFIHRSSGDFLPVKVVETMLLSRFRSSYADILNSRPPLPSFYMSLEEATSLATSCLKHRAFMDAHGPDIKFSSDDLVVNMQDFIAFFSAIKNAICSKYGNLSVADNLSATKEAPGGWLQLQNTIVPYVMRGTTRLLPLSVVQHAAGLCTGSEQGSFAINVNEVAILNRLCSSVKIKFEFKSSSRLIPLDTILLKEPGTNVRLLPLNNPIVSAQMISPKNSSPRNSVVNGEHVRMPRISTVNPCMPSLDPRMQGLVVPTRGRRRAMLNDINFASPGYPLYPEYQNMPPNQMPNVPFPAQYHSTSSSSVRLNMNPGYGIQNITPSVPKTLTRMPRVRGRISPTVIEILDSPVGSPQAATTSPDDLPKTENSIKPWSLDLKSNDTENNEASSSNAVSPESGDNLNASVITSNEAVGTLDNIIDNCKETEASSNINNQIASSNADDKMSVDSISVIKPVDSDDTVSSSKSDQFSMPIIGSIVSLAPVAHSGIILDEVKASDIEGSLITFDTTLPVVSQQSSFVPVNSNALADLFSVAANENALVHITGENSGNDEIIIRGNGIELTEVSPHQILDSGLEGLPIEQYNPIGSLKELVPIVSSVNTSSMLHSMGNNNPTSFAMSAAQGAANVFPVARTLAPPFQMPMAPEMMMPGMNNMFGSQTFYPPVPNVNFSYGRRATYHPRIRNSWRTQAPYRLPLNMNGGSVRGPFLRTTQAMPSQHEIQQCISRIKSVRAFGKCLSCIERGSRRFVLIEAIGRVFFPRTRVEEFARVVTTVLRIPLEIPTLAEEKAFIAFYSLPTTRLRCNQMVSLDVFEQFMPRLQYIFRNASADKQAVVIDDDDDDVICLQEQPAKRARSDLSLQAQSSPSEVPCSSNANPTLTSHSGTKQYQSPAFNVSPNTRQNSSQSVNDVICLE